MLAGLMTFSKYPQGYFPQLCITAVSLPGTERGTIGDDGERFIDNKRITGAIPDMLEEAVEFVRKNRRTKTIIDDNGRRADKPEYPIKVVREAILNALVHHDYSIHIRNAALANMLELLNVTENRYSGIPTMRSEFANAGLSAPIFSAVHGEFKAVMKNGLFAETMPVSDSLVESGKLKMTIPEKPKSPKQQFVKA